MLNVISSGLPVSAKDIISEAVRLAFGDGVVEMVELNTENLRYSVRLSSRDTSCVLVVLDRVSTDLCKDIENGLYSESKFHTYIEDTDLVEFLNSKFGLQMSIPESNEDILLSKEDLSGISEELLERYETQLLDKDSLISSLQNRIKELEWYIEEGYIEVETTEATTEKIESLEKENLELRDKLLNIESSMHDSEISKESLESKIAELENSVKQVESKRDSIMLEYKSLSKELTDLKVVSSKQAGVIRTKDSEISVLKKQLSTVSDLQEQLAYYKKEYDRLSNEISSYEVKYSNISIELETKTKEIDRLNRELKENGVSSELLESLKDELSGVYEERDSLLRKKSELETSLKNLEMEKGNFSRLSDELKSNILSLECKIKEDDKTITLLNSEKIEMQSKIRLLEQTSDGSLSNEDLVLELAELRRNYDKLQNSVYGKVGSLSMPNASMSIRLLSGNNKFKNIRFVFSGNSESRKGTYKCLYNEFKSLPNNNNGRKILIVDVVSETFIDYVFEMDHIVSGIDWFRRGGGVQQYLSKTCNDNVRVLSMGLGYVNDSYFLSIDWESRLRELDNSGYNVVIYCGDVSNIVGRVLHESFASHGNSYIYVHGNAIGSRTIVSNLKGISNSVDSVIAYFEFNPKMSRFVDMVKKTNKCRLISVLGK